jgi:SagB-type dehydrogenase family enzyme
LELYVVTHDGFFHYRPATHDMEVRGREDLRPDLAGVAMGEEAVRDAAAVFVIAAVEKRTAQKYGLRAHRYVVLEAGHAAQNLLLQTTALGLGAAPVGAFDDDALHAVLELARGETVLYLIPVGTPAGVGGGA